MPLHVSVPVDTGQILHGTPNKMTSARTVAFFKSARDSCLHELWADTFASLDGPHLPHVHAISSEISPFRCQRQTLRCKINYFPFDLQPSTHPSHKSTPSLIISKKHRTGCPKISDNQR